MKTAREMLDEAAQEHYIKSPSMGASPFGLDGIPYARRNAIAKLMRAYASEIAKEVLKRAAENVTFEEVETAFMQSEFQVDKDSILNTEYQDLLK